MIKISIFYLGLILSQFYIFKSGLPQISHVIFALSFLSLLFYSLKVKDLNNNIAMLFLCIYIIILNLFYSIIESEFLFNIASIFMIFNLGVYFFIIRFFNKMDNIKYIILISIFLSFALWSIGLGRYNFGERYNAFFNDPNQYAYWILCLSCSFLILNKNKVLSMVFLSLSSILIIFTFSRSALVGVIIMWFYYLITFFKFNIKNLVQGVSFLSLFLIILFLAKDYLITSLSLEVYGNRVADTDLESQADIRGYSRLIEYPEYLIFGAGQGLDTRFNHSHEIHSTWAGILFYYGIIGMILFLYSLYKIFKKLDWREKILFLAPMFYGLSTFGFRNTIFWIFLAIFYSIAYNKEKKKEVYK